MPSKSFSPISGIKITIESDYSSRNCDEIINDLRKFYESGFDIDEANDNIDKLDKIFGIVQDIDLNDLEQARDYIDEIESIIN